jgi:hypothetical protein
MKFDVAERARLECEFAKQIGTVVDQLVSSDFSEDDTFTFVSSVKIFLKFEDIRDYIIDVLFEKAKTIASVPFETHIETHRLVSDYKSIRKLIRVIVSISEDSLIEALATFFLKGNDPSYYFILLEEMVKKKHNTEVVEYIFLSLISAGNYDLNRIIKFLEILGKNSAYLTSLLLNNKLYSSLRRYVSLLNIIELQETVVPLIVKGYDDTNDKYLGVVLEALCVSEKVIRPLLVNCEESFTKFLLGGHAYNMPALKNYLGYLAEYNPQVISSFENQLLETDKEYLIRQYALHLPLNNKRKILRLLITSKQEATLVEFIKKYPEFESLLPML